MEKFKRLGIYQKIIMLFMILTVLVFSVVYFMTIKREGFEYKNAILIQKQENDNTIYSGRIHGKQTKIIVSADKTVEFQIGDKLYGPYTAKEDSSAIPKDSELGESMTGIEIYNDKEILFRGGVMKHDDGWWLFNEDGSLENLAGSWGTIDGIEMDDGGNVIDPMEPSVSTILDLMTDPELVHKGEWLVWFYGVCVCIATACSMLLADELFRWNLAFRIRNVENAEPSEWEIVSRYIFWTVLPIMAMVIFITGLQ